MMNYLEVADSLGMWLATMPAMIIVFVQVILYCKKSIELSKEVQLTKEERNNALRAGVITAVGPSISNIIVMISMVAVIGAPITWIRCSLIGSPTAELSAATFAAEAMGLTLGGEGYNLNAYACATWVMALNGAGWIVFCLLFAHRMGSVSKKLTKGNAVLFGAVASAATLGAMSYMAGANITAGGSKMIAVFAAIACMIVLKFVCKKYPNFAKYNLSVALVVAMATGQICKMMGM